MSNTKGWRVVGFDDGVQRIFGKLNQQAAEAEQLAVLGEFQTEYDDWRATRPASDAWMDRPLRKLYAKAAAAVAALGRDEVNRRHEAFVAGWEREQKERAEWEREVKRARDAHEPAPPHYLHAKEAWRDYQYKRQFRGGRS